MTTPLIEIPPFESFTKIARLSRDCVVTEKIDGTNAHVLVLDDGRVIAASRNRYLTLDADNFGFARWVDEHATELRRLGPGRHYGEWYGSGIQRRYGLDEKRFALFNVARWVDEHGTNARASAKQCVAPACCYVVPVLYRGEFRTWTIEGVMLDLVSRGSSAAPGFMQPEGVVVWHEAARILFKKTVEGDEAPKSAAVAP